MPARCLNSTTNKLQTTAVQNIKDENRPTSKIATQPKYEVDTGVDENISMHSINKEECGQENTLTLKEDQDTRSTEMATANGNKADGIQVAEEGTSKTPDWD